jgi:hypothetical protein
MADAALFCAVHDIMQSCASLDNIVAHLRPGSPVAAIGGKQPALWMWPLRPCVTRLHEPFISDFTGFDRPWHQLAKYAPTSRCANSPSPPATSPSATPRCSGRWGRSS